MGRRTLTLTPAQKAEVETLAAVLNAEQVADYFGIGRTTFFAMIQRDPEIGERYKRGKARAIGAVARSAIRPERSEDRTDCAADQASGARDPIPSVRKALRRLIAKARGGDTACMIFCLKTQAGWRETATIEHAAAFEPPGEAGGGKDALVRFLDEIAARQTTRIGIPGPGEPDR